MRISILVWAFSVAAAIGAPQPEQDLGARELFYAALVKKDAPPPVRRTSAAQPGAQAKFESQAASAEAVHLGLRYNLVLVDAVSGKSWDVAPDRVFQTGECFAINFESNRAGFLYVLAKESSGSWHLLVPSTDPDMADETNVITPGQKVRVPLRHCFEIQNPPGAETLFVVLSREPRDSFEMSEGIKNRQAAEPTAAPSLPPSAPAPRNAPAILMADAAISNSAVERMRQDFGTRDIAIKRVGQPLANDEPAGSVYVVNASATPSPNLAAQIEVRHRSTPAIFGCARASPRFYRNRSGRSAGRAASESCRRRLRIPGPCRLRRRWGMGKRV